MTLTASNFHVKRSHYEMVSAILREGWLIQPEWAEQHLLLALQVLEGKAVWPDALQTKAGSDANGDAIFGSVRQDGNVRIIDVSGPLTKYGGMCSYGTVDYQQMLEEAYADDSVDAVVMRVESPGGEVRGIASLYDLVRSNLKPVVAQVEDLAASAGYYIIAGAAHIQATQPTDQIGSIGVYTTLRDYSKYMEKYGISTKEVYSRLSSEKNMDYREAQAGNVEPLQDRLDVLAGAFIDAVKASRAGKLNAEAGDPFKGRTYFAKDAQSVGLIDSIGTLHQAVAKARELAAERRTNVSSFFFTNNQSDMFGNPFSKITALKGVAAADITPEMVDAINAQLTERGIAGIVAVNTDWVTEAESLEGQVTALTKERDQLQTQVTKLTQERDQARTERDAFGEQPGEKPTQVQKAKDDIQTTEAASWEQMVDGLESTKLAKANGLW